MIDLILPTVTGREESLARCIESYERNTAPGVLNIVVIRDEPTVGIAWQKGIAQTDGPYVHLSCDDLEMTSPTWAAVCVETVDAGRLPCPIIWRPDDSLESCGGDMSAPACLISHMRANGTPTDFSPVPFMSREQADAIGMIAAHYLSDVYASHKGRALGYETVLARGYEFIHHHEMTGRKPPSGDDQHHYNAAMA